MVWARETDNLRLKFLSATSKWALWVTCDSATCVIWSVTWDSTSWHCWDGREGYEFHCPLPSLAQSNHSKAIFTCNSGIEKKYHLKAKAPGHGPCRQWRWKCQSLSRVSFQPHGLQPARLLCPWNFPGKNPGVGSQFPFPGHLPDSGIEPRSPALQANSLPSEPPGKPCRQNLR